MSQERRGILLVANRPPGPAGCSVLAVGIVFLGAALYGLYGDGSLKPGTGLAHGFVGGSLFAIVIGTILIAAQRAAARTWRGFALGPDGAARAVIRAADPEVPEPVRYEPIPPSGKAEPGLAFVLMHTESLILAHIAYHDGSVARVGVNCPTARLAILPGGKLAACQVAMTGPNGLRPLADALRAHCPGLPVTLLVASPRADRSMKTPFLFGLVGTVLEEAFASRQDRKSSAALDQALGGDLGRELAAFCEEYGWTLENA